MGSHPVPRTRRQLAGLDAYLAGAQWSNAIRIPIRVGEARDRLTILAELAHGKAVVDLGCADAGQVDEKISAGLWLHRRLVEAAERCIGIDIDSEAVARLHELGEPDIYVGDLSQPLEAVDGERWDLLVMGELLEHIDDPVAFLQAIRSRHSGRIGQVALSVPNAFALRNLLHVVRGLEVINSDHRYWFTPYTLAKVLARAGMEPEWFTFCDRLPRRSGFAGRSRSAMLNLIFGRVPAFRTELIMVARIP